MAESGLRQSGLKQPDLYQAAPRIIPLAKIVRVHGIPRNEGSVLSFKAELFNPGGEIFRGKKEIWLSDPGPDSVFKQVSPLQIAPWGGSWGQARGVLLDFDKKIYEPLIGAQVGLPRGDFPVLKKGFYLCDVLGSSVADETGQPVGTIRRFREVSGAITLEASKGDTDSSFEFPFEWIDLENSTTDCLRVPEVGQWMNLK